MYKTIGKIARLFKREILRDSFLLEVKRWFKDDGDNTLRLDYPLDENSVVWDLGGYQGDFAAQIYQRYRCQVYVFEPMPSFYEKCAARFVGNNNIHCLKFGLSDKAGWFDISNSDDASSFVRGNPASGSQQAELRPVIDMFDVLNLNRVDLLKINIEGGEYDVLPALIESGLISRVRYIQIQFHDFIPGAREKRDAIRAALGDTHVEMWNYPFVWESWATRQQTGN